MMQDGKATSSCLLNVRPHAEVGVNVDSQVTYTVVDGVMASCMQTAAADVVDGQWHTTGAPSYRCLVEDGWIASSCVVSNDS